MQRRSLELRSLVEVAEEVQRLHTKGYDRAGTWDLAQVCQHLTDSVTASVQGFDAKVPWLIRKLIGRAFFKKIRAQRSMKAGYKLPDKYIPPAGLDEAEKVQGLRRAVETFQNHPGPLAEHPFFGPLSREEWTDLHLIHASHHLSFLVPLANPQPTSPAGLA